MAKILVFDIEATNLSADMGYILCIGYKWVGEKKVHILDITKSKTFKKDVTDDKEIVKAFAKIVEEADAVIAHFGKYFDVPYIQTRLLMNGLRPLPPVKLIDTWRTMKKKLKLHSNRLASGISAFDPSVKKTPLDGRMWVKASAGDKKAIKYVVEHCIADVQALENVYKKIRVVDDLHPNLNVIDNRPEKCPTCGEIGRMFRRGYRAAKTTRYAKLQCQECGGWFSAPIKKDGTLGRVR